MANSGNSMSSAQPLIPVFKGDVYQYWNIRLKTLLKSQDLWEFVENGCPTEDDKALMKENKRKDAKALAII